VPVTIKENVDQEGTATANGVCRSSARATGRTSVWTAEVIEARHGLPTPIDPVP